MNEMNRQTLALSIIGLLLSGFLGAVFGGWISSIPAYEQSNTLKQELDIMRQSLERKANLIMTVLPSNAVTVYGHPNGTVEVRNSMLTLSKTNEFYFTMYVSNVGDAFAHLLYYSVILGIEPNHTVVSVYNIEPIVLKPDENTSFNYTFIPTNIPSEMLGDAHFINLTFALGSAEMSVYKVVEARF